MPEVLKREHAFISYSHKDERFAQKVKNDLEALGITIWIDDELEPGTPIWEQAIRDAMKGSLAVVLIASPYAKEGPYVRGELHLAESHRLEVLPLWIEGNTWIECVPFSLSDTQYIDARDSRYAIGLAQLANKLQQVNNDRSPKHCLLTKEASEEYRCIIHRYLAAYKPNQADIAALREDYIYIELSDGEIVAMKHTAYPSFRELSDDLYVAYLQDRSSYQSFTYGNRWVLGTYAHTYSACRQLLVPWRWLSLPKNRSLADEELGWSDFSPQYWFASYHLRFLQVLDKLPPLAFGLTTNTSHTAQRLLFGKEGNALGWHVSEMLDGKHSPTSSWFQYTVTLVQRPEQIHPQDYLHHFILAPSRRRHSSNYVSPGEMTRVACILTLAPKYE